MTPELNAILAERTKLEAQLAANLEAEAAELARYAAANRIFADGQPVLYRGHTLTVAGAFGVSLPDGLDVVYGLNRQGEPFDSAYGRNLEPAPAAPVTV